MHILHIFMYKYIAYCIFSDEYNPNCSKWGYCVNLPVFGTDGPGISKVGLLVSFFLISDCLWINRQSNLCNPSKNLFFSFFSIERLILRIYILRMECFGHSHWSKSFGMSSKEIQYCAALTFQHLGAFVKSS